MMIHFPSTGIRPSVNHHNCRIDVLADWIEGSVLFTGTRVSKTDVLDIFFEHQIYRDEEFAREFIFNIWAELRYRIKYGRIQALSIDTAGIESKQGWIEFPAYCFCLFLSLKDWCSSTDAPSYIEQGEMFEKITECSLIARGWRSLRTGWSSTNVNSLGTLVEQISSHIDAPVRPDFKEKISPGDKDGGLDLICDLPFSDSRGGYPLYFFQCASGRSWREKTNDINIRLWENLIDFSNQPGSGFAIPYVLSKKEFLRIAGRVNGILLDRLRIIEPLSENTKEFTTELKSELINWLNPRISSLLPE